VTPVHGSDGRALGTSLRVVVSGSASLTRARAATDRAVRDIDAACSRFREDSELSRVNARAGCETRISPMLVRAVRAALRGARLSGGAVDPTVGTAMRVIGYDGDFDRIRGDGPSITVRETPVPGWRCVRLSEVTASVYLPHGVELDLGSTAKALCSDLAASAATHVMGGGGVLVSLGGDIAVGGECPPGGWSIEVAEASVGAPGEATGDEHIAIRTGGVATSSTTVRRWRRGDAVLHHIVDPCTGLPTAGPWRTVTSVARSCLDANIAATAAIVRGDEAPPWLRELGLPSRLVRHDGSIARIAGWPHA
jgi:thiamine biosynthesis lipoprotein